MNEVDWKKQSKAIITIEKNGEKTKKKIAINSNVYAYISSKLIKPLKKNQQLIRRNARPSLQHLIDLLCMSIVNFHIEKWTDTMFVRFLSFSLFLPSFYSSCFAVAIFCVHVQYSGFDPLAFKCKYFLCFI